VPGRPADRGSAVVDFVLVSPMLVLVGVAVLQLVLALVVKTTLTTAAVEGARAAALAGSAPAMGEARVRQVLAGTVAEPSLVAVDVHPEREDGVPVMAARIEYRLPFLGLIAPVTLTVDGHVLIEGVA
jgi:hypothetical protein